MKKILFLLFTLASFASFGQTTNVFKWIEMKSVDTTAFPMRVGQFWYNPTVGKFTFHDASGYTHFGIGGLTNTAANNEFPKSTGSGSGIVASGLFSSTLGNLDLGTTSLSGDRTISAKSSSTNNSLYFQTTNGSSTATNALQLFISGTKTVLVGSPGNLSLNGSSYAGRMLIGSAFGFDFANYPGQLSLVAATNSSSPSGVLYPFRVINTPSSGTPSTGFGAGIEFGVSNAAVSVNLIAATLGAESTGMGAGVENFDIVFRSMTGGAVASEKLRINSAGAIGLSGANYGTAGQTIVSGGPGAAVTWGAGGGSGTVSTVSVVTANGLAGTVANPTTTPAITLSTPITGLVKGNGTAFSAASAGTDYQAPITLTTAGVSGASTFIGNTLNVPNYSSPAFNVKNYGAVGDGIQTSANGAITSPTSNFTCSTCTFVPGDVGKTIEIPGAAGSGAGTDLVTTITAYVSATAITIAATASTTVTTSTCWYGTNDTAAIQAAVNACSASGTGTVFFPKGVYIISGPLITSDNNGLNPNSQIYIPSSPVINGGTFPISQTIYFEGEGWQALGLEAPGYRFGTTLKSTLVTGTGTRPSMIGGKGIAYTYPFNYNGLTIRRMSIFTSSNGGATATNMIAVNGLNLAQTSTADVSIQPDMNPQIVTTMPTALGTGSAGLVIGQGNNNGPNNIRNTTVNGYEHGFVCGEHTNFENSYATFNYNGITVIPNNFYSVNGYVYMGENAYFINRPNATFYGVTPATLIYQALDLIMDIEFSSSTGPTWTHNIAFINDPGVLLMGEITQKTASGTSAGTQNSNQLIGASPNPFLNIHPMNAAFAGAYATSGGALGHYPGFPNTTNVNNWGVFEVSSGIASAGTNSGWGVLDVATNQSGTAHTVGVMNFVNSNITGGVSENRIYNIGVSTNGATNTGKKIDNILNAGSFVQVSQITAALYGINIPIATGTTNSNIYRNTNAGGDVTSHFLIDPASSLTAGIAYTFDATNGFGFTQGNATRRIQGAAIKPSGLTSTAGSEVMGLDFFTQSGGTAATSKMTLSGTGNVGIGVTPVSKLDVAGSVGLQVTVVSTDLTLDGTYYTVLVDASGANRTITLPAVAGVAKRIYVVKKTDSSANSVTIDGNASETIDGATTKLVNTQYAGWQIQANAAGTAWFITATF